jgi:O-antigen/teichoic acid export membrane protein
MLNSTSLKTRFLVSVGTNIIRGIIGFVTGLLIARSLGPSSYGDFAFLMGSFAAILSLLNMGTSNAFYTFLSRCSQGSTFFLTYLVWIGLQFAISLLLVSWIIPDNLFQKIWLGHDRGVVLVALLAAFLLQQVWPSVTEIGESMRKTVKVQLLNLCIAIAYLTIVVLLMVLGIISLINIFLLIIAQYIIATFLAYWVLGGNQIACNEEDKSLKQIVREYWEYCKPLVIAALFVFIYSFADNWLLQNYGGSVQQGYFGVASKFAAVSMLITTSMLKVFWKEIAHSVENQDFVRVELLYRKVNRGLVILGATISGLLIPWSEQIVTLVLGTPYVKAWPVLALMLLYPVHQSMGQIGGVMLLARGQTKIYMYLTVGVTSVSLPITYIMLTPTANYGLDMGALGIALKMVLLGVVSVNIQALIIAHYSGWKFDWVFQVVGIPLMIMLGYCVKLLIGLVWNLSNISVTNLIIPVLSNFLIYALFVLWIIWLLPWLVGLEKKDLDSMLESLMRRKNLALLNSGKA